VSFNAVLRQSPRSTLPKFWPSLGQPPVCIGGNGACPPEDCHDPAAFMSGNVHAVSWEALEDLGTMAEILEQVVIEQRADLGY
jgi:hypothetical protein